MRELTRNDVDAAITGGMLLSAGGSGRARMAKDVAFGEAALARGPVRLISANTLPANAQVLVASAVGAPGGAARVVKPEHSIAAARLLVEASGCRPAAVIPGHVPGIYAWLVAAALDIPLLDAACNGRGHPTVKMGSLGLASQPHVWLHQCAVGEKVRMVVEGNAMLTSQLMRAAAVQNGGLVMACRGPLPASLICSAGARGAIDYQLRLGHAMRDAGMQSAARVAAVLDFTGGRVLAQGHIASSSVQYCDGFDLGEVVVETGAHALRLTVCNEFMAAQDEHTRLATFPDLIAALDPESGEVLAISELVSGKPVIVVAVSKRDLPMGSGIYDPEVYVDVEKSTGVELARYALDPAA